MLHHRISIHASRGGSDQYPVKSFFISYISIHASRGGSDLQRYHKYFLWQISIHASRGGSDHGCKYILDALVFQSTLPAGEATIKAMMTNAKVIISIHASRGGSDCQRHLIKIMIGKFQSTLPAGEATGSHRRLRPCHPYFNPRFPRGKRRQATGAAEAITPFQSTLPAGEATVRSSCPLMTARSSMGSANRDFPVFLSAVSMLFFFWALGVRAYRIMVPLGSYPFFVPI